MECRIDWERFPANRGGQITLVKPVPISTAMDEGGASLPKEADPSVLRENLCNELGVTAQYLGIGVDRIDYTKGIGERFLAVERFLEKHPDYQGKFTFVEIGAPSRTLIQRYHSLGPSSTPRWTGSTADSRAGNGNRRVPEEAHSHRRSPRISRFRPVHVTSLHDGMNLVAKEFVAARTDCQGVLILSHFTELPGNCGRRADQSL